MSEDTFTLGAGQTLRVVETSAEELHLESTWTAGESKPPPRHLHPRQDERFEVLAGELTVEVGGEPRRVLSAGESLEVPRGTAHRMWNAGEQTARATWRVTPALRTEQMLRFIGEGMSPPRVATLLWRYRDEYRLARRPR
ncbi:MAG: cupin domain-containing protein [Thermocrispum sp.]